MVGHIRDLALRLHGTLRVLNAEREDHLIFPERNRIHDGGLDFFHHERVVVLNHADLRRGLQRNDARQLQIVELFLETLALVFKIICRLRVLGKPALLRLFAQLHERRRALLRELFLPGEDIHRQLLEVFEVLLIHLVHDRDVLHERELVLVQLGSNFIDICLCLAVLCLHLLRAHLRLAEKTCDALLFRFVHALELDDKARHHVADFAEVARLDLGERRLRKIGNVLLRRRTVLQHLR